MEYVKKLIEEAGVVAVPGCGFFHSTLPAEKSSEPKFEYHKRYIRFAFCKSSATLAAAAQKLGNLQQQNGWYAIVDLVMNDQDVKKRTNSTAI